MAARYYAQIEITQEEDDAGFASDDDSDSNLSFNDVNVDADLSDIEVQEFFEEESGESESEDSESESDESIAIDEPEWSRDLHAFDIEPFSGSHGLKVPVPVEAKAVDFFGLLFGEPVFDLIVEETNCCARQKLARSAARLAKWIDVNKRELKAYFGLCIIMGIDTLPRIAMNWSSNRYIGNIRVQETMKKNRFEEISQYMHFSDSTQEPQRREFQMSHMGSVDRADQLCSSYCSGWQSKKWYKYIFWFLFNVSVCNAFVLESEHVGSKRELVYFKLDLAQQLLDGFSQ